MSVTDAEGRTTTFENDDLGRVTAAVSPDTGTTRYAYDEAGNLAEKKDAQGSLVTYAYDAANRLTSISAPGETISMSYDGAGRANGQGRLTTVVDGTGTTRYDYDTLGRVTRTETVIDAQSYTTSYGYDPTGNLASITYPSGRETLYDHDPADRISRVRLQQGATITPLADEIAWMPFGPVRGWKYGNGLAASRRYDLQYRLSELYAGNLSRSYTHNHSGDVIAIDVHIPEPAPAAAPDLTYAYAAGTSRLATVTETGQPAVPFGHDARGNVTTYGDKTFTYDALGRMTEARVNGNLAGAYAYNFRNQRAKKTAGATTTIYHYDLSGNLIEETTAGAGDNTKSYVYLGNDLGAMPLAMAAAAGNIYAYHTDHLGTPQRLSDAAGTTVWEAGYTAFGHATVNEDPDGDATPVTQNLRFPGQYFDQETGLHYNWNRYYAPELGRYLQPDPLGTKGDDLGLYSYTRNNPLRRIDPAGLNSTASLGGACLGLIAVDGPAPAGDALCACLLLLPPAAMAVQSVVNSMAQSISNSCGGTQSCEGTDQPPPPQPPKKGCRFIREVVPPGGGPCKSCWYECPGYGAPVIFPQAVGKPCPPVGANGLVDTSLIDPICRGAGVP